MIKWELTEARSVLLKLAERGENLAPVMRELAGLLESESEDSFALQRSPSGELWAALTAATIAGRQAEGHWPGKKLQRSGRLASSLVSDYGADFAEIGTNLDYAAVMFFGAKKGAFGTDRHGRPIPWGDIPEREYMGLSEAGEEEALDMLTRHLLAG